MLPRKPYLDRHVFKFPIFRFFNESIFNFLAVTFTYSVYFSLFSSVLTSFEARFWLDPGFCLSSATDGVPVVEVGRRWYTGVLFRFRRLRNSSNREVTSVKLGAYILRLKVFHLRTGTETEPVLCTASG